MAEDPAADIGTLDGATDTPAEGGSRAALSAAVSILLAGLAVAAGVTLFG